MYFLVLLWPKHFTDVIPGVIIFILVALSFTIFIAWYQRRLARIQVKDLGLQDAEFIRVKLFTETLHSIYGEASSAEGQLYVCDHFIFIRPLPGSLSSGDLPIVFSNNPDSIKARTKINNIYFPDSIQPGEGGSVEIVYQGNPGISTKTSLIIDFCGKGDYERVSSQMFKG